MRPFTTHLLTATFESVLESIVVTILAWLVTGAISITGAAEKDWAGCGCSEHKCGHSPRPAALGSIYASLTARSWDDIADSAGRCGRGTCLQSKLSTSEQGRLPALVILRESLPGIARGLGSIPNQFTRVSFEGVGRYCTHAQTVLPEDSKSFARLAASSDHFRQQSSSVGVYGIGSDLEYDLDDAVDERENEEEFRDWR
jgi:hypothetical protein